jgi:short-subunit dehydrogenase
MNRVSNHTKTVLITGASSGIGAALAREYARRGAQLLLLARRAVRLQALAEELRANGTRVWVCEGDVTVDGDVKNAIAAAQTEGHAVDVVIANAGYSVSGTLQMLTLEDYRRQYETNVFGVLRTVYETLPALRASSGRLVIMGSVAGHAAAPGASAYASSKFAVRALADSLRGDLRREGIGLTLISPGFVDSDIRRTDNGGALHANAADPIPAWVRMRAGKAARKMVNAIENERAELVVTFHGKLIVFFARHFPALIRRVALRYVRWRKPPGVA